MIDVSIIIPTFRRPRSLERALASCIAQAEVASGVCEIVVVDNCPRGSARETAERVRVESGSAIVYRLETAAGPSHARNAGVHAARGERLVFLDDDEEATPGWLAALLAAQARLDADVVFGPVLPRWEGEPELDERFVSIFFSRCDPGPTRLIDGYHGSGNALLMRSRCILDDRPFDPAMARCGGEDTILFERLRRLGRRFAWCAEAPVYEYVPQDRTGFRYLCRRSFRRGQSPSYACALVSPADRLGVARWMAIGAGQALVFAPLALALAAVRSRHALDFTRRAIEGTGKLLWMQPFRPRDYGGPRR